MLNTQPDETQGSSDSPSDGELAVPMRLLESITDGVVT